jgi:DNA-binding XRE family transcriptional regulator
MNQLQTLSQSIARDFPMAEVTVDKPVSATGSWWLDVSLEGRDATIEWRKGRGFGLTVGEAEPMDSGAHEIYGSVREVKKRLYGCLRSGEQTASATSGALGELRAHVGLSQAQLAQRLGVSQAAISQMESGDDIQITTLKRVVKALGGELSVVARFPAREFEIETPRQRRVGSPRRTKRHGA